MKSGSMSSFNAAATPEARIGGERDDESPHDYCREALLVLLAWAHEANSRLTYEVDDGRQFGGNPELNPIFKMANRALGKE